MEVKKIKEDLVSFNRWEIAQKSEREFWDGYTSESLSKELEKMYLKKVEFQNPPACTLKQPGTIRGRDYIRGF